MENKKMVRIICGTYGHRENGGIRAKYAGDVFEAADTEAKRLVSLGVAEYVESDAEAEVGGELTIAKIKERLDALGVEYPKSAVKAELLELLAEAEEGGDEIPPDLSTGE